MRSSDNRKVLVDMSATLIHHGHVRLIKEASLLGQVTVALSTDEAVQEAKGYLPELGFEFRKEILLAMRFVNDVIPAPWIISQEFLTKHNFDVLVHGDDNFNTVEPSNLVIIPRTQDISSSILRLRACEILKEGR